MNLNSFRIHITKETATRCKLSEMINVIMFLFFKLI